MDKTTVIVLVVVVLIVVGVIMYQSSVQAQRDRELALQLQQMQNPQQTQDNFWSSLGDMGTLIGTIGGLFGGGGSAPTTSRVGSIESGDDVPYTTTEQAAMNGWEYLRARVEGQEYPSIITSASKDDPYTML